ncbi:MAG: hypothetical protein WBF71_12795 [Microthrixaceae bacterium]
MTINLSEGFAGYIAVPGQVFLGVTHDGVLRWKHELSGNPYDPFAPLVWEVVGPGRRGSAAWIRLSEPDPGASVDAVANRILKVARKFYARGGSFEGCRRELLRQPANAAVSLPILLSMMGQDEEAVRYIELCMNGKKPLNRFPDNYQRFAERLAAAPRPLAPEGPPGMNRPGFVGGS